MNVSRNGTTSLTPDEMVAAVDNFRYRSTAIERATAVLRAELERAVEAGMVLRESHIQLDADNRLLRDEIKSLYASPSYMRIAALEDDLTEAKAEADHNYRLISRQGRLLSATVNVLRGDPPDDTLWSVHDVAELAAASVARVHALEEVAIAFAEYLDDMEQSVWSDKIRAIAKREVPA